MEQHCAEPVTLLDNGHQPDTYKVDKRHIFERESNKIIYMTLHDSQNYFKSRSELISRPNRSNHGLQT